MNAAWDRAFPHCVHDAAGRRTPVTLRMGVSATITPPWAQDAGSDTNVKALLKRLRESQVSLMVLDLPAGAALPEELPARCWAVERHTRQLTLGELDPVESWPSHRKKQLRRAEREGMAVSAASDVDLLVNLHQASRHRKGLNSDEIMLRRLLTELLQESDTCALVVKNSQGEPLAGGVFHGAEDNRCIYGFGGQFRTDAPGESSRASVMLIAEAMRHASKTGKTIFDFGGSMDTGVDRFYAEFGAVKVTKWKIVRAAAWLRPLLRWYRPDLIS